MKNLKSVVTAIALTIILSTSTMAGNIGGMRSNTTDSVQVNATGNIGGLRAEASIASQLSIFIKGNIGGMLVTILSLP